MEFEDVSTYRSFVTWLVIWYQCSFFFCLDALLVAISFLFSSSLLILALRHSFTPFTNFSFIYLFQYATSSRLCGQSWYTHIHDKSQELIYILRLLVSRGSHSRQVRFTAFVLCILSTGGLPCVIENSFDSLFPLLLVIPIPHSAVISFFYYVWLFGCFLLSWISCPRQSCV